MLLGEYAFQKKTFANIDATFKPFNQKSFKELHDRKRSDQVNRTLLELIKKEPEPCFLLSAVIDFVERVEREKILNHYTFTSFELWLNQFSGLSLEENLHARGKISGKWLPREEYQIYFPIGMGKMYEGSHFVTAHKSPDLDTTIASFWGWIDAFSAKVGTGLHIWNVPGGIPESQIEIDLIFKGIFGKGVITHLAKTKTTLSLTGNDLMTQREMLKKKIYENVSHIHHDRDKKAVVVVGEDDDYLGDWRSTDFEGTRQVLILLNSCLRWFENNLHINLISLFSRTDLKASDLPKFTQDIFNVKMKECDPVVEFSSKEKESLDRLLKIVLGVHSGIEASFKEFGEALKNLALVDFSLVPNLLSAIEKTELFDKSGKLVENRPLIFKELGKIVEGLHVATQNIRAYMERLDVALKMKTQVFGYSPKFITVRAEVEEIRSKMESHSYLTVTYPDRHLFYPVGVIYASDLRKNILGTVSLRDFCNREEVTIPSYLEIISVIDHHKSSLSTFSPPLAVIADSQSSNAIVAELSFRINDRFSHLGMSLSDIEEECKKISLSSLKQGEAVRLSKLLQFQQILKRESHYFIHPEREFIEYLHFLYGILDDTDLLSKVSGRDVESVIGILNRMKSLIQKSPVEIISLDDIPRNKDFARNAAKKILQNEDMYSLYRKVYSYREKEIEKNILLCAKHQGSILFLDTKEQNGCCRVGQTKMFLENRSTFLQNREKIQKSWCESAMALWKKKPEYDLHIHMISTIVSAEEVYHNRNKKYDHKDEMWIWIPFNDTAIEHLKRFLTVFQDSPQIIHNELELELLGENAEEFSQIFSESFLPLEGKVTFSNKNLPIAVLYYKAGSLNSRKAMISPYLPSLQS